MSARLSRRELLAGALVLPWLASCGESTQPANRPPEPTWPETRGHPRPGSPRADNLSPGSPAHQRPRPAVDLEEGIIYSSFWPGRSVRWRLARPVNGGPLVEPRPLVIALHGHGGNADSAFKRAHLERYVVATGLAVASIDGGNSYWHARRSGVDPQRLILQNLLPLLKQKGMNTERFGLIGWSMGGYGALLLASRLGPGRVAGVVAVSAALWPSPGAGGADAFDGYADFARNDVFAARRRLRRIPVLLDCGRSDQFLAANQRFARGLQSAATTFGEGGHTEKYWRAHAGAQMTWLSARLR